jgi:hypothetical protein
MRATIRLSRFITLASTLILAMLFPILAQATPASFEWGTFSATGQTTFGVYDLNNTTILQTGDLAQFIWAGPDRLIDPPMPDGSPGGDDLILDVSAIQNSGSLPPPARNKGYIPLKTFSFDTDAPQNGGTVYIRAWNASTPASATAYGDSQTGILSSGGVLNAPRWNTNYRFMTWVGAAHGNWNSTSNWTGGVIPDSSTYAILPVGSSPILTANGTSRVLFIGDGAVLDLTSFVLSVDNKLVNMGTLRQTKAVNSSCTSVSPCRFLNIRNIAGNLNMYYGVDLATGNNLGNVTVTVKGNASSCTQDPTSQPYVHRCFTITPDTIGSATVWLWALVSEQNGISQVNLAPYHNVGGANWEKLVNINTGNDGAAYVFSQGDTNGFSSFLLGNTNAGPTAIQLKIFQATSHQNSYWLFIILLGLFVGVLLLRWILKQRLDHRLKAG